MRDNNKKDQREQTLPVTDLSHECTFPVLDAPSAINFDDKCRTESSFSLSSHTTAIFQVGKDPDPYRRGCRAQQTLLLNL